MQFWAIEDLYCQARRVFSPSRALQVPSVTICEMCLGDARFRVERNVNLKSDDHDALNLACSGEPTEWKEIVVSKYIDTTRCGASPTPRSAQWHLVLWLTRWRWQNRDSLGAIRIRLAILSLPDTDSGVGCARKASPASTVRFLPNMRLAAALPLLENHALRDSDVSFPPNCSNPLISEVPIATATREQVPPTTKHIQFQRYLSAQILTVNRYHRTIWQALLTLSGG